MRYFIPLSLHSEGSHRKDSRVHGHCVVRARIKITVRRGRRKTTKEKRGEERKYDLSSIWRIFYHISYSVWLYMWWGKKIYNPMTNNLHLKTKHESTTRNGASRQTVVWLARQHVEDYRKYCWNAGVQCVSKPQEQKDSSRDLWATEGGAGGVGTGQLTS